MTSRGRPSAPEARFLDEAELEALLRSVPRDCLGQVERSLYVTAAMTRLRMGELLGLRWEDVGLDRAAHPRAPGVRCAASSRRRSVRGRRGVPLAAELHAELDDLSFVSDSLGADDDWSSDIR